MGDNLVMTEYEHALYEAVRVLGLAVLELGGSRDTIQSGIEEMREDMAKDGRKNGAATLTLLLQAWLEPPYIPGNSN
jgi:hypothetical protein